MASKISTRFVNQARNQVFLAGLYQKLESRHYIVQSRNMATAIPFEPKPELLPLIERQPYQFAAHVRGHFDEQSRKANASIDVFYVHRPSLGSINSTITAMGMLGRSGVAKIEGENPVPSFAELKQRMAEQFAISTEDADYILGSDKGSTTCLNQVYLTGFVGNKAFVAPSLESDTDGYVTFQLLQFPDLDRAIPVRVMRANQAFGKMLRKGQPINIVASVAVETRTDSEGVTTTQVYLKTDRDKVSMALATDFEGKTFPKWWRDLITQHLVGATDPQPEGERVSTARAPRKQPSRAETVPDGLPGVPALADVPDDEIPYVDR